MWRFRMFWQVFGTMTVLVVLSLGLLGFFVTHRVEQDELKVVEERLRAKAILVREAIRNDKPGRGLLEPGRLQQLYREVPGRITLIAADGTVLADSGVSDPAALGTRADRPEVIAAKTQPHGVSTRYSTTLQRLLTYVAVRVENPNGPVAFVRVALPLQDTQERLAGINRLIWTAAAVTAVLTLAMAFWLARRITRPLQELTETA